MKKKFISGYNHPAILNALRDEHNVKAMANRPALGWFPAQDWVDKIRNAMLSVAPEGLNQVILKFYCHCALISLFLRNHETFLHRR